MTVIPITSAPRLASQASEATITTLQLPVASVAVCRMRYAPETGAGEALHAAEILAEVGRHQGLAHVDLEGPGDPMASMAATLATVALLKQQHPELTIGLTTLGLGIGEHAAELAAAWVNSVTLLVETLDAATAENLYAWIRPGKKTIPLKQAVPLLLEEQAKAVAIMAAAGMTVHVRTTVYPGINAHQIVTIAETMAQLGAMAMHLVPCVPDPQQANGPGVPTRVHMEQIAKLTSQFLPTKAQQVTVAACGCGCGVQSPGVPGQDPAAFDCSPDCGCGCGAVTQARPGLPKPSAERPRVAVVSSTGMDVDLHLGQARTILIYGPRADGLTCLLETRQAPEPGSGESRWEQLADTLHDCFALLAASAGGRPREVLGGRGIRVVLTEDNIEGTVDVLYGGGKKHKCKQ